MCESQSLSSENHVCPMFSAASNKLKDTLGLLFYELKDIRRRGLIKPVSKFQKVYRHQPLHGSLDAGFLEIRGFQLTTSMCKFWQ